MDLLESVLRTADAEEYMSNFRKERIDNSALKLLTFEDLILMGVEEKKANDILQRLKNLIIRSETKCETIVDEEYASIVLVHIAKQLSLHQANMICAATKPDVVNCNVRLLRGVDTLRATLNDFEQELQLLKGKVLQAGGRRVKKKKKVFVLVSGATLSIVLATGLVFLYKSLR